MNSQLRTRLRVPRLAAAAVATTLISGLVVGAMAPAQANPGDGTPGQNAGTGDVWITSAKTVAEGQKISFAGENFALSSGVAPVLNAKWDALNGNTLYQGVGQTGVGQMAGVAGTFQVQGDGTVSGSMIVPNDLDEQSVNPTYFEGPHYLRMLTGGVSVYSEDFEVDNAAAPAPTVTATAVTTSSRGTNAVTVTVAGSGFVANEDVSVNRALADTNLKWTVGTGTATSKVDTIKADASGKLSGKLVLDFGVLRAGEHQLVFQRSSDANNPATAQVTVTNHVALAKVALGSQGTVTVSNNMEGATFDSLTLDPNPAVAGDEISVLDGAPIVANADGVATGTFTIPDNIELLGNKNFTLRQTKPSAATQTIASQKVSPSTEPLNEDDFTILENPGTIEQGLYQSAYSREPEALFAAAADRMATSTIYKLDPATLAVEDSVVPANETAANKWAAYGIGVDDKNDTVWVTNTRQNTVAVYKQDDLTLLKQHPRDTLNHTRDVIADPERDVVYVSSASEGTTGQGAIGVFEADDLDNDGNKYEFIKNIATYDRTEYSPMSLELDQDSRKLFSPSLTSNKVAVVDLDAVDLTPVAIPADQTGASYRAAANAAVTLLTFDDLTVGGRGASGMAYDNESKTLFIASQNSDEVLVARVSDDFKSARTVKEIATGAGALNVSFDPVNNVAYVANFGGTTVTVLDVNGNRVANLPVARPNHVHENGLGSVFAVDKDVDNKVYKISPKNPILAGEQKVGQTLSAFPALDLEANADAAASYQWKIDGAPVEGATAQTFKLKAAHLDKTVSVDVSVAGTTPSTDTLTASAPVAVGALKVTPKITGNPAIGAQLTASAGAQDEDVTVAYQWLRNGEPIAGATTDSYTVTAADGGAKLSVTATASATGYTVVSKTSEQVSVPKGKLTVAVPKISGTAVVGKTLTGSVQVPAGASASYSWKRNNVAIAGATRNSYRPVAADLGKKLTVSVTVTAAGYTTRTVTSAATASVKAAALVAARPKIVGTAKVGKTLTAKAGTWTKGAKLSYKWTANGKAIKGGTKAKLKLTKKLKGKKVVVAVTGKLAGYTTVTKKSLAKKVK